MTVAQNTNRDKTFWAVNVMFSLVAVAFLTWLVFQKGRSDADLRYIPLVNACLNTSAAICLVAGWRAIRRGDKEAHRALMILAFICSSLFLAGYVVYHAVHGDTKFLGVGVIRYAYYGILASHILLSLFVVPLSLAAFYYAFSKRFSAHKRVTRVLSPIWLYVSVTGVVIYILLHQVYAR